MHRIKYWLFIQLVCISSITFANVIEHFNSIKSDPAALYAFFKEMPKGGELHYHLAGGQYAETMLALAAHGNYSIDPKTFAISALDVPAHPLPTSRGLSAGSRDLKSIMDPADKPRDVEYGTRSKQFQPGIDTDLYNKTVRAWSMKDFIPGHESGHDHFFATFYKFWPLVSDFQAQLLADTIKRAANQHELYMEIMVSLDNGRSKRFASISKNESSFATKEQALLADKGFQNNLAATIANGKHLLKEAHRQLGCNTFPQQLVCGVTVKFQYEVAREQPLENIFSQALNGFAAAAQSDDIVAVNLVQPEDGFISLRDYHAQMEIFKFLHTAWPNVHIALHAGELTPNIAPPESLRFHIHDAISTGQAERIGHGVDITHEDNDNELLNHMATTPVPVEINLTSNREILLVSGKEHPLGYYIKHHVPVVLSTDDEGILRTDLTQQYVDAVVEHKLDYPAIKAINRNALTYSFLPGKSLWANAAKQITVPECNVLSSTSCQQFIKNNMKARLQWELENRLNRFEGEFHTNLPSPSGVL